LVVDDSDTMRKVIAMYLKELGVTQVDQAADGAPAVELAAQNAYDCIVMDWNMPQMTGFDALKAIRASGNPVPVVIVSTENEKRRVIQAIAAGATGYVMKPFVKNVFLERLRPILAPA
jgi:two-component system chemotaxis response regulator CheY